MNKFYITILGLVSFLIANSASAQKIFLKADDLTKGASKVAGYLDYAEITSLQFGASFDRSWKTTGAPTGKPNFKDIIITKNVDISSNRFLDKLIKGTTVGLIEIVSTTNDGSDINVVHKIELKDSYITNVSSSTVQGCTGNCPAIAESYELVYRAIRITTYTVDSAGKTVQTVATYNVAMNNTTF